ncbi:phBC6A51 family helix-turn-helix protein [Bacillus cereus]|uniref:phBC6A51 family helix-turn-helix protein n=1 Tax=Bacillus cereus TaxID=1396 RepID=UPI002D7869EB|nr:phBC6A51 family helix-turn-helix protein [Bacillus cereus]MCU4863121.1 phBC6A51 family helix-turn-helix protein [Bacillus cereus]
MALTDIQKKCALVMIEHPEISQQALAEELGVHRNTIGNWNRNKEFIEYKNDLAMDVHKSFLADTLKILREKTLDKHSRGHSRYLEMALKTYGVMTEKSEQTVTVKEEKSEKDLLDELLND